MTLYRTGEIGTKAFEIMLVAVRLAVLTGWILIFTFMGMFFGLIPPVAGIIGGIAGICLFMAHPVFELTTVYCSDCQTTVKTLKRIGSYKCPCGKELYIYDKEIREYDTMAG